MKCKLLREGCTGAQMLMVVEALVCQLITAIELHDLINQKETPLHLKQPCM